jgi:integrase
LPAVLTGDEVVRFLTAVSDLKMRTIFITIYAAGLRVSEAVALTAKDIDSARMVIALRQARLKPLCGAGTRRSRHPRQLDRPQSSRHTDAGNRTVLIEALTNLTPMQRAGTSEEVAKLVLFLASDDSSVITGSDFVIDGGFVTGAAIKELMRTLKAAGA